MKNKIVLLSIAFIQVALVACNVVFIANSAVIAMIMTNFGISMMWSYNIKKIAMSSFWDRVFYAIGATLGTYCGYLFSHYIIK
jgi:hypothetical protein